MAKTELSAEELRSMLRGGRNCLRSHAGEIDALNVFPVPDGDTGKNMALTFEGGVAACAPGKSAGAMMADAARGMLLSARGNSGVILSQFFRGFAQGMDICERLTLSALIQALETGTEYAYRAVIRPVEGTMLTVMRECAEYARAHETEFACMEDAFSALLAQMRESLSRTPDLLPTLKEAGVVDSGGAGFLRIFEGMARALLGEETGDADVEIEETPAAGKADDADLTEFGYCTEFILKLLNARAPVADFSLDDLIGRLEQLGDSLVAVRDGDLVKVHVHSFRPEAVLALGRMYGEFVSVKIENMAVQHSELAPRPAEQAPRKRYALAAVASGEGICAYFSEIGVDAVIDGGQTQNPSAEDFLRAFRSLNAEHIVVLPNNSNVVLTALHAAELYPEGDVRVLKTRSISEGYAALSMLDLESESVEELMAGMEDAMAGVRTGYVTNATRDAHLDGIEVRKGDFLALEGEKIRYDGTDKVEAVLRLLEDCFGEDGPEVLVAFCGKDVTDEEKERLQDELEQRYPMLDLGLIDGGQELYSFILSME